MSDTVIISIVSGVVTLVGTIFAGCMTYFMAKLSKQGIAAATRVEEVAAKVANVKDDLIQRDEDTIVKLARIEANIATPKE